MREQVLSEASWRALASHHARRAEHWTAPHLDRRRRGLAHPVLDFLFEYYPYSPGRLRTWHPGLGTALEGAWRPASNVAAYIQTPSGWLADPRKLDGARLALALRILEGTHSRPPQHSCFGMHEWAMVYRMDQRQVRHGGQPLRLPVDEISAVVDEVGLRCTHVDAFRFFTDEAVPLNAVQPTRISQPELEQSGCIHANMDLFKYAMWFQPYLPGGLVLDCFELSVQAREVDMRASPYDIEDLGYPPIAIETPQGRLEYTREQRMITERAAPIRCELMRRLRAVEDSATRVPSA